MTELTIHIFDDRNEKKMTNHVAVIEEGTLKVSVIASTRFKVMKEHTGTYIKANLVIKAVNYY